MTLLFFSASLFIYLFMYLFIYFNFTGVAVFTRDRTGHLDTGFITTISYKEVLKIIMVAFCNTMLNI